MSPRSRRSRQAILGHAGEARAVTASFEALGPELQETIVRFLETLQVLPPDARALVVDEHGASKVWPPRR